MGLSKRDLALVYGIAYAATSAASEEEKKKSKNQDQPTKEEK